ncbi:hypothetical protein BY996DRAFT_6415641 [Phakopsora pachyrhizi]|nr:hypothetical protein BY996DRAFT_6415641 [Phakopsora pachyrhizi]
MLFATLIAVCLLALGGKAESDVQSDTASKLQRRGHDDSLPPVTFIMRDSNEHVGGKLLIYNSDGTLAFTFRRAVLNSDGLSNVEVRDVRNNFSINLESSHYVEREKNLGQFKIDPRGAKADRWHFTRKTPHGDFKYDFHRKYFSKDGNIYIKDTHVRVASLTSEIRHEAWLQPGKHGVPTFSLHLQYNTEPIFFVALMGLDLTRVDTCGL